jgi:hypothetical protein
MSNAQRAASRAKRFPTKGGSRKMKRRGGKNTRRK